MPFSNSINNAPINLIIGGGYISQYHIRASLANKFKVKVIEIDKLKRKYLNYLFPEITIYKELDDFFEEHPKTDIDLLSILIPKKFRRLLYKNLPILDCKVIIEKPLTLECTKQFNNENCFICLNQSFNKSGILITRKFFNNKRINKVVSNRPDPKSLLRQEKYEEYLLDYLPHTLTPLHLIFYKESPYLKIKNISEKNISGNYCTSSDQIDFEVNLTDQDFDTFLYSNRNKYSYDNCLINKNSSFFKLNKNIQTINSIINNQWGYSTMYRLYKELKKYNKSRKNNLLIDKLLISNSLYLAEENYV